MKIPKWFLLLFTAALLFRTIGSLWPSDHAGVSAGMTLRAPR